MPFTIVRLGLFFFNLEISELDWNRNRISCYVFIHYTYNFLSDEITRNCFFHFSKKIRFTRVLLIISRIQTMDVKLLSESPFVFPFSFYPCMWTSVFFLLHPVCFSALRLFCLALFMWLPVALSYVNLVRQLGVEKPCVVGRRDCFTLSERSSPQLCHLPEAVLLTDLQGGSAAGVAVEAVRLLSCVPRSWHKEPPSELNSELSVKSK